MYAIINAGTKDTLDCLTLSREVAELLRCNDGTYYSNIKAKSIHEALDKLENNSIDVDYVRNTEELQFIEEKDILEILTLKFIGGKFYIVNTLRYINYEENVIRYNSEINELTISTNLRHNELAHQGILKLNSKLEPYRNLILSQIEIDALISELITSCFTEHTYIRPFVK